MRVLIDTNILVSYLLKHGSESATRSVASAAILGDFTMLLPEDLLGELVSRVSRKPYLANRVTTADLEALVGILLDVAEVVPAITSQIPAVCRDPKDDYLLAHALVGQADYLVTGDRDLLALGEVEGMRIVTAAHLVEILHLGSE